MDFAEIEKFRNNNGYIELDKMENLILQDNIVGRKAKYWILLDDIKILFKETNPNSYEDYAQLFFSQFLDQCGLEHAKYDLAILNGKRGIITPNFLKPGEMLVSGKTLLDSTKRTYLENNIDKEITNSAESAMDAMILFNFDLELVQETMKQMIQLILVDGLLLETDRNSTNWSIITESRNVRLSPIYDGSNMCGLNRSVSDINSKLAQLRNEGTLQSLIASSQRSFFLNNRTKDQSFIEEVQYICRNYGEYIHDFVPNLCGIDVDLAQKKIEEQIKAEVPFQTVIWIDKLVKFNKTNLQYACCSEGLLNDTDVLTKKRIR